MVLDVYGENTRKIEEEKTLKAVTFLPIDNGTIKRGDLIGVVKVFVVGVSRKKKIEVPTVNIEMKSYDVNIVYRTNGEIVREKERVSEYWYRRWHIAEWYPLIADESLDVKPGEVEPMNYPFERSFFRSIRLYGKKLRTGVKGLPIGASSYSSC